MVLLRTVFCTVCGTPSSLVGIRCAACGDADTCESLFMFVYFCFCYRSERPSKYVMSGARAYLTELESREEGWRDQLSEISKVSKVKVGVPKTQEDGWEHTYRVTGEDIVASSRCGPPNLLRFPLFTFFVTPFTRPRMCLVARECCPALALHRIHILGHSP